MRRRSLLSLYPHQWQQRYEEEIGALFEDGPLTVAVVIDLLRGALDAHLHPELVAPSLVASTGSGQIRLVPMSLRILYGLAGLVTAYGAAHGITPFNLVLDIGLALIVLALVVGWREKRSFVAVWPALLLFCALFAISGASTLTMPVCVGPGPVPCVASRAAQAITVAAWLGSLLAAFLAIRDLKMARRRR